MVARINAGANPSGAVLYNEHKVAHGEARFLGGANAISLSQDFITVRDKIEELERYARGNENISKPTFHASLAFHPSEKLSDQKIAQIGHEYMDRLGYGQQPYLIYRHEDTQHPHIHIVSVSVDFEGKRISDSHQQRRSNAIRKDIEKEHGLVEAESQGKEIVMTGLLPEQVLNYPEAEAKKAIGNVVRTALSDYNFTAIEPFTEFLNHHRVQLNQLEGVGLDGKPYKGITFQLHNGNGDQRGESVGPAIKASRFSFAPTAERLDEKFRKNAVRIDAGKPATRQRIHNALRGFRKLSEADFKGQLRANGIQVLDTGKQFIYIDHKNRNVYQEAELGNIYTRQAQQAAFAQQSVRTSATPERVVSAPSAAKQGQKEPIQGQAAKEPVKQKQEPTGPTSEQIALRKRVSHYYQQVRQQGLAGKSPVFFESQLIRDFPNKYLTNALIAEKVDPVAARQAVAQFETYKQGQLPEIRAKEGSYFTQTAEQFVSLAVAMPISASSKTAFLFAAGYEFNPKTSELTHREDNQLSYKLPKSVKDQLQADTGEKVAFTNKLNKYERSAYLALATGQPLPNTISFYQIPSAQLKAATGPLFNSIAPALNKAFGEQVDKLIKPDQAVFSQLRQRGILVEATANGAYRMGHYLTDPASFTPVKPEIARLLKSMELPTLAAQQQVLGNPTGKQLSELTLNLDTSNATRLQQQLTNWYRQTNQPVFKGSVLEQASALQATLSSLLNKTTTSQATNKETVVGQKEAVVGQIPTPKESPVRQPSVYGSFAVSLLEKSTLSPQDRYHVASQLGMVWQRSESGQLGLKERNNLPSNGNAYTLTEQQQKNFTAPPPAQASAIRLTEADKTFLRGFIQNKTFPDLSRQQVAALTIPVIATILPEPNKTGFHQWYNQQRGRQIVEDTQKQFGEQTSARRYLSALFQRGFVVKQDMDPTGKASYRMGYFQAPTATFVAVPKNVENLFLKSFPTQIGKNNYMIEGAWPAPNSATAHRMRALARSVDSGQTPDQINDQIAKAHQRFPQLKSVSQPQSLLDRLVSQPKSTMSASLSAMQVSKPSTSAASPNEKSDPLEKLLNQFEQQGSQHGLLDALGDSATGIRPRKKRIGEDLSNRKKGPKR